MNLGEPHHDIHVWITDVELLGGHWGYNVDIAHHRPKFVAAFLSVDKLMMENRTLTIIYASQNLSFIFYMSLFSLVLVLLRSGTD